MGTKTKATTESNTKESTNALSIEEQLREYVKHPNGAIFRILAHPRKLGKVYLQSKNSYKEFDFLAIKNGLVAGDWLAINQHELKKHLKSEELYREQLTRKLIKRVLFTQLLMELDDSLKEDYENDNYVRGILERYEKVFERLVTEQYAKFYSIDKQMVLNFLKHIETFVEKAINLGIEDFYQVNEMLDLYLSNPEKYHSDVVMLEKID